MRKYWNFFQEIYVAAQVMWVNYVRYVDISISVKKKERSWFNVCI